MSETKGLRQQNYSDSGYSYYLHRSLSAPGARLRCLETLHSIPT